MGSAIWNIVIGGIAIAAALSGKYALPFTSSPTPLLVVGIAIAGVGVYQLVKSKRR